VPLADSANPLVARVAIVDGTIAELEAVHPVTLPHLSAFGHEPGLAKAKFLRCEGVQLRLIQLLDRLRECYPKLVELRKPLLYRLS
jgi:hypothetical protein